jgi:hypothetical protein
MRIWNCASISLSWVLSGWVLSGWVLLSCAAVPAPCSTADTCADGFECLAHRCVAAGSEPVAEDGERLIATVTELAVLAESTSYNGQLPGAISFGARRTGDLTVLLRFDPVWKKTKNLGEAFLLFEAAPQSRPDPTPVPIDVWRIEEPWSAGESSWLEQPELAYPTARGVANASGAPLQVDVTRLIRRLQAHPQRDYGIAVKATATDGFGVSYATGVAGGRAPRIEVYSP